MSSQELNSRYFVPEGKEIHFDIYGRPYYKEGGRIMLSARKPYHYQIAN